MGQFALLNKTNYVQLTFLGYIIVKKGLAELNYSQPQWCLMQ